MNVGCFGDVLEIEFFEMIFNLENKNNIIHVLNYEIHPSKKTTTNKQANKKQKLKKKIKSQKSKSNHPLKKNKNKKKQKKNRDENYQEKVNKRLQGGIVIVVGNERSDTGSNPGRGCLHFK